MGYALFAQRKLVISGLINSVQLQQTQRSDEQMRLATNTISLQADITALQANQSYKLQDLYSELSSADDSSERESIQSDIKGVQEEFEGEIAQINQKIYMISIKENALEMEVKRLDTRLEALKKQRDIIEKAEQDGIDKSTPKFSGLG